MFRPRVKGKVRLSQEHHATCPLWLDIIGIILGIIALYISGDIFLEEALHVGIKYGISSKSVGTYIISFGAVIDEFAVVFSSSIRGYGSLSFGTIQGSNVITLIIFLPILALVARKNFSGFRKDGYVLLAVSLVALAMSVQWIRDPWYLGIPMIAIYALYALVNRRPAGDIEGNYAQDNANYVEPQGKRIIDQGKKGEKN